MSVLQSPNTTKSQVGIYVALGAVIAVLAVPLYYPIAKLMAGVSESEVLDPTVLVGVIAAVATGIAGFLNAVRPDKIVDRIIRLLAEYKSPRAVYKWWNRVQNGELNKHIAQVGLISQIWEQKWWTSIKDDCHSSIASTIEDRSVQSVLWSAKVDSVVGLVLSLSMIPVFPYAPLLAGSIAVIGLFVIVGPWFRIDIYNLHLRIRMIAVLRHTRDSMAKVDPPWSQRVQTIAETEIVLSEGQWNRVETRYRRLEHELEQSAQKVDREAYLSRAWASSFHQIMQAKNQKTSHSIFEEHFLSVRDAFQFAGLLEEKSKWATLKKADISNPSQFFDVVNFEQAYSKHPELTKDFEKLENDSDKVIWVNAISSQGTSLRNGFIKPFYLFACSYAYDDIKDAFYKRIANLAGTKTPVENTTDRVVSRLLKLDWGTEGLEDLLVDIGTSHHVDAAVKSTILKFAMTKIKEGNLAERLVHYLRDDRSDKDLQKDIANLRQALTNAGVILP